MILKLMIASFAYTKLPFTILYIYIYTCTSWPCTTMTQIPHVYIWYIINNNIVSCLSTTESISIYIYIYINFIMENSVVTHINILFHILSYTFFWKIHEFANLPPPPKSKISLNKFFPNKKPPFRRCRILSSEQAQATALWTPGWLGWFLAGWDFLPNYVGDYKDPYYKGIPFFHQPWIQWKVMRCFFSWLKWKRTKKNNYRKRKQPQHAKMTSYIFFFQLPLEYISLTTLGIC